ncbi:MAG: PDC sensor domain-containing protein [Campylobacterota bacterium]|nr:PDC sensor domain-containing protein [Campylobacterota bacterium]
MQEFMKTYKNNVEDIENFLRETIQNCGDLGLKQDSNFKKLFDVFPYLELIYICDPVKRIQISPNIEADRIVESQKGRSREYMLSKLNIQAGTTVVSQPYISSASGKTCVTVGKEENGKVYLMDFELTALLQKLGLVNVHQRFNLISEGFYFMTANVMMLLALFTVAYALFDFAHSMFIAVDFSIESIFKPVIALTLGLAIFDLAKTILEQEVVFKSYAKHGSAEYKVLIKFSITIIIALLIESLMVVFKIAIDDYTAMVHALYLLTGVAVIMLALGGFIYFTKEKHAQEIKK